MKLCCRCKIQKELSEFNKDSSFTDGLRPFCRECSKKESRARYAINKEKELQRNRCRYHNNKEQEKVRKAAYYKENIDKERVRKAKYYQENRHRLLSVSQKWQNNNPDYKAYKSAKRRSAKSLASLSWMTEVHYKQIRWYYAAAKMMSDTSGMPYEVDHIHPLQGKFFSGLHVPWNLRVIKASDNRLKTNKPPADEAHLFWI